MNRIYVIKLPFRLPTDTSSSPERLVHAYLIHGRDSRVLIDTGVAPSHERLVQALREQGCAPTDLDWIVNTHAHADHAGGNRIFQDAYDTPIACHESAARWLENMDLQAEERPVSGFEQLVSGSSTVSRLLQEGDKIELGDTTLEVIFTPGHAPGLISLYCPQNGTLITGDTLPLWNGLPLYYDVDIERSSLQRLLALDGVERLFHSHVTKPFTGDGVRKALYEGLAVLDRMEEIVFETIKALPDEASLEDITYESLRRLGFKHPPVIPMTMISIEAHLKHAL